jgi:hypothetical protein
MGEEIEGGIEGVAYDTQPTPMGEEIGGGIEGVAYDT